MIEPLAEKCYIALIQAGETAATPEYAYKLARDFIAHQKLRMILQQLNVETLDEAVDKLGTTRELLLKFTERTTLAASYQEIADDLEISLEQFAAAWGVDPEDLKQPTQEDVQELSTSLAVAAENVVPIGASTGGTNPNG